MLMNLSNEFVILFLAAQEDHARGFLVGCLSEEIL